MTKLSKLKPEPSDFGLWMNNLWAAFTLMDTKDDVRLLFRDIFTHTEYKMFTKRFEIARRLLAEKKYEEISRDLGVSLGTIAQVSNILVQRGDGFKKAHEKLLAMEKEIVRKKAEYQNKLERRVRKKLPGETVLWDAASAGVEVVDRAVAKRRKRKSLIKQLKV